MSADEEVLVFLIRWCRLCCIHTMQKWYMYIVPVITLSMLKQKYFLYLEYLFC